MERHPTNPAIVDRALTNRDTPNGSSPKDECYPPLRHPRSSHQFPLRIAESSAKLNLRNGSFPTPKPYLLQKHGLKELEAPASPLMAGNTLLSIADDDVQQVSPKVVLSTVRSFYIGTLLSCVLLTVLVYDHGEIVYPFYLFPKAHPWATSMHIR